MKIRYWVEEYKITIALAVFSIVYVTVCSLFFDVGLSPDSTNYLREANALLKGYGFNNHAGTGREGFYGIWPIGYPALIALVAFFTRLEVFYAARLITVGIYVITTVMFIKRFKRNAWIYLLFFCNPGYIYCMRYVSSENLYLFAMLWFAFAVYDVWSDENGENKNYIMIGAASLFAIFSRWVGAFTLAITGLMGILNLCGITVEKNGKKAIKLFVLTIVNTTVLLCYLMAIKEATGYMTGMYRIPSEESKLWLLEMLIKAETIELYSSVFGVFSVNNILAVCLWIGLFYFFIRKMVKDKFKDKFVPSLVLTSVTYWCGYVYTRFQTNMEIFNHRVLLPATLPLIIAVVYCALENRKVLQFVNGFHTSEKRRTILVILLFILSFELHNGCKILKKPDTYVSMKRECEDMYKNIPSGSLVITEDWEINFLRMDLKRCSVFDCDSDQLEDIVYNMNAEDYPHVYLQKAYLEYLFCMEEDENSYPELRKYLNLDEYLIQLK